MNAKGFIQLARSKEIVVTAVKVSVVVGSILVLINHHEKFLTLAFTRADILKIALTYLVPYSVSTWSAVKALQRRMAE